MTRSDLLAELYRRLGYASSPASEITTRLASFLNLTHRQLLSTPGLDRLRDHTITFASVASTPQYGLPPAVSRVQAITDRSQDRKLQLRSLDWIRSVDPGLDNTGTPDYYALTGLQAVSVQPSDASDIFVDSTSASDTNTAYIEGIRTGGHRTALSVTMTGQTAVSLKGSALITDIIEITKFYLSAAAVGEVTLHEDASGGTELAKIAIGQTFSRYQGIQLWPTPTGATTYYVDYVRTIPDMSNANDEPLVPEDFHWLLVEGALIKEWTKKDDADRRQEAKDAFRRGLSDLLYQVGCPADWMPSRLPATEPPSRLGGWFPSRQW